MHRKHIATCAIALRIYHLGKMLQQCINPTAKSPRINECFDCAKLQSFLSVSDARRGTTMRDEFASKSFLAVTIAGLVLLCSGFGMVVFTFS
jgi:hypothetical protein